MKVDRRLKIIFYITFSLLYLSGAVEYALSLVNTDIGPSPQQALALRIHGIVGLWFLYLFGHFFKAHIWPSLRQFRHRKSGITLWLMLIFLSLNVPFLYYLANEKFRAMIALFHTYVGLAVMIPLVIHVWLAIYRR